MKAQINRKAFLQASLATTLVGLVGCAGEGAEGGDGDGDMGSGGSDPAGSGGAGSGGDAAGSGGAGTGGDQATGGDGSGGATGGDGSGGDSGGLTCTQDIVVESSGDLPSGHTHSLTVTAAMLEAGVAVPGLETGPAPSAGNHTHTVDLTADDIATLKSGGVVIKFTCSGNDHEFAISCDPGAPEPTPTVDGWLEGSCPQE